MEQGIDHDLTQKIDDLFKENAKKVSTGNGPLRTALMEFDLTEEELNSVLAFSQVHMEFQALLSLPKAVSIIVAFSAGLLVGKILTEQKKEGKE